MFLRRFHVVNTSGDQTMDYINLRKTFGSLKNHASLIENLALLKQRLFQENVRDLIKHVKNVSF